jgi:hypothetical protein
LTFYANSTTARRETDLWTVDGSNNPSAQIPNGVILTDASGAYSAFAGPDDVDTLYLNAHTGAARTAIAASGYVACVPLHVAVGIARSGPWPSVASMASPPTVVRPDAWGHAAYDDAGVPAGRRPELSDRHVGHL